MATPLPLPGPRVALTIHGTIGNGPIPLHLGDTTMSEQSSEQSVVGIYKTMDEAEQDRPRTGHGRVPGHVQCSIVTRDVSSEKTVHGYVTAHDVRRTTFGVPAALTVPSGFLLLRPATPLKGGTPISI